MRSRQISISLAAATLAISGSTITFAQTAPPPPGTTVRMVAISQKTQRLFDGIQATLGCTNEEFAAISPLVRKVMQLQSEDQSDRGRIKAARDQQTRTATQAGADSPPGKAPPADFDLSQPLNDQQNTINQMYAALEQPGAAPDLIANKLAAYRAARDKTEADLLEAQNSLKQLLTPKQEAALVIRGILP